MFGYRSVGGGRREGTFWFGNEDIARVSRILSAFKCVNVMFSNGRYYGKHASTGGTLQVSCPGKHLRETLLHKALSNQQSKGNRCRLFWKEEGLHCKGCSDWSLCDALAQKPVAIDWSIELISTNSIVSVFGVLGRLVVQLIFGIASQTVSFP